MFYGMLVVMLQIKEGEYKCQKNFYMVVESFLEGRTD